VAMVVTRPWVMSLAQVTPEASLRLPRAVAAALAVPMTEVRNASMYFLAMQ